VGSASCARDGSGTIRAANASARCAAPSQAKLADQWKRAAIHVTSSGPATAPAVTDACSAVIVRAERAA
jgi:hypothetical protein